MDLRLLTALLADTLSQGPTPEAHGPLGEGAQRITEVLRRRDVAELLDQFDTKVDTALTLTH